MLIDATMNLDYDPDSKLGGAQFPPLVWPAQDDLDAAKARWPEFGLKPPERGEGSDSFSAGFIPRASL